MKNLKYIREYINYLLKEDIDFDENDFEWIQDEVLFKVRDTIDIPYSKSERLVERTDEDGIYIRKNMPYDILSYVENVEYREDGKMVISIRGKWPLYLAEDIAKYNSVKESIDFDENDWDYEEEESEKTIKRGEPFSYYQKFYKKRVRIIDANKEGFIKGISLRHGLNILIQFDNGRREWVKPERLEVLNINESIDFDENDWDWIDEESEEGKKVRLGDTIFKVGDKITHVNVSGYGRIVDITDDKIYIKFDDISSITEFRIRSVIKLIDNGFNFLHKVNESIDINEDDFDWEEEDHISKEELMNYFILVDTDEECRIVAKKLVEMGFKVYNYDQLMRYGRSDGGVIIWRKLRYTGSSWTRSNSNTGTSKEPELDFKTFMELV